MHSYFTIGELVENLYEFVQSYLYVLMTFILPTAQTVCLGQIS